MDGKKTRGREECRKGQEDLRRLMSKSPKSA